MADIWEVRDAIAAEGKTPWVVIPTNGIIRADNQATMGLGLALQAAERFPELPISLARHLEKHGNCMGVFASWNIITFPTKQHWRDPARLDLISKAADDLYMFLAENQDEVVLVPRVGCGVNTGQLKWKGQVKPLLTKKWQEYLQLARIIFVEP